jgi:hypothetical protein
MHPNFRNFHFKKKGLIPAVLALASSPSQKQQQREQGLE